MKCEEEEEEAEVGTTSATDGVRVLLEEEEEEDMEACETGRLIELAAAAESCCTSIDMAPLLPPRQRVPSPQPPGSPALACARRCRRTTSACDIGPPGSFVHPTIDALALALAFLPVEYLLSLGSTM